MSDVHILVEESVKIAWDFLERSGEIIDGYEASRFLMSAVGRMALAGERRKLMLANRAIDAYRAGRREAA